MLKHFFLKSVTKNTIFVMLIGVFIKILIS